MAVELDFYDLRAKEKFFTTKYKVVNKGARRFAVAESPSGTTSWRALPKGFTK